MLIIYTVNNLIFYINNNYLLLYVVKLYLYVIVSITLCKYFSKLLFYNYIMLYIKY